MADKPSIIKMKKREWVKLAKEVQKIFEAEAEEAEKKAKRTSKYAS